MDTWDCFLVIGEKDSVLHHNCEARCRFSRNVLSHDEEVLFYFIDFFFSETIVEFCLMIFLYLFKIIIRFFFPSLLIYFES